MNFSKIKSYLLNIALLLTLLTPFLVPTATYAASGSTSIKCTGATTSGIQTGANLNGNNSTVNCGNMYVRSKSLRNLAGSVVNLFSILVGAISVIMIIYGGFRYITSGGATEKVGDAKKTLIYAIIGLIVVALAQLIIHFVLNQASNISTGS
jgi:hypothetical protein